MVINLLIVLIPFLSGLTWLLKETDYLRVNLSFYCETGACSQWHMPDDAVDDSMKHELCYSWTKLDTTTKACFLSGAESPLCGWGYAWQYRNFSPEYKFELISGGVHHTMHIKDPKIIKDVMRVNKLNKKMRLAYA